MRRFAQLVRGYPRENTLKIYNWSDYIDEELIAEFEEWYQQQTGEEYMWSTSCSISTK